MKPEPKNTREVGRVNDAELATYQPPTIVPLGDAVEATMGEDDGESEYKGGFVTWY